MDSFLPISSLVDARVLVPLFPLTLKKTFYTDRQQDVSFYNDTFFIFLDGADSQEVTLPVTALGTIYFIITGVTDIAIDNVESFTTLSANTLYGLRSNGTSYDVFYTGANVSAFYPEYINNSVENITSAIVHILPNNPITRQINIDLHLLQEEHLFIVYDTAGRASKVPVVVSFDKPCSGSDTLTLASNNSYIIVLYTPDIGYTLLAQNGTLLETGLIQGMFQFKDNNTAYNNPLTLGFSEGYLSSLTGG